MNCKFDRELLQDLLEGNIDPIERIFAEEHLKTCKECRKEFTQLKLLLWELGDKQNFEVDIPEELDELKNAVINRIIDNETVNTSKMVMDKQIKTLKTTSLFLEFVPGIKESEKLFKEGVKAAPSALGKASKVMVKGAKMLLAR